MSLSTWGSYRERFFLVDMIPAGFRRNVLLWTPTHMDIDFGLFIRLVLPILLYTCHKKKLVT